MIDKLIEALVVMSVGITGVFVSLLFFYLLTLILNVIDSKINKIRVDKKLSKNAGEVNADTLGVRPEIVAVISAAAYEMYRKPVIIKKIKFLKKSETNWSESGRMIIMGSHNIFKSK